MTTLRLYTSPRPRVLVRRLLARRIIVKRILVKRDAAGAGGGADVAHPSGDVQRQYTGAQPQAVGVQIARWQVTQRLPELDIFETLLDLRAMAMKIRPLVILSG